MPDNQSSSWACGVAWYPCGFGSHRHAFKSHQAHFFHTIDGMEFPVWFLLNVIYQKNRRTRNNSSLSMVRLSIFMLPRHRQPLSISPLVDFQFQDISTCRLNTLYQHFNSKNDSSKCVSIFPIFLTTPFFYILKS
jgi:hypothetical protein